MPWKWQKPGDVTKSGFGDNSFDVCTTIEVLEQRLVEMGACSACADNIAQYYSKNSDSRCGKLAQQALDGNSEAINELVAFTDYCKWKY